MPQRNVEVLRGLFEAYSSRDIDGFIACCDPGIELVTAFAAVGGEVYHGHDGLHTWHRDVEDVWGGAVHTEPEAYFDLGERTLVFYVLHGRGKHSGVEVAMPVALVARRPRRPREGVCPPGGRTPRPGRLRGRAGADRAVTASASASSASISR